MSTTTPMRDFSFNPDFSVLLFKLKDALLGSDFTAKIEQNNYQHLMFSTNVRLIVVGMITATGIYVHYADGLWSAWYLYVAAVALLLTHFLFGNIWMAFSQLRKGDLLQADKLLQATTHPNWLLRRHRAYYYFTQGMIQMQRKQINLAEPNLQQALDLGLRTDNDNALAALNLAHIAFVEKRYEEASKRLQKTKSFNTNDLMIKENISNMETALEGRLN